MAWTEGQRAALSQQRGKAASYIQDKDDRQKYMSEQGDLEAKHKGAANVPDHEYDRMSRDADDTIALQGANKAAGARSQMSSYKKGTDNVPRTGVAILHKGEAVLKKEDADKYRSAKSVYGSAAHSLGGESKHKKEIKEIRTRKAKSGGYIHEHHHTHPEDFPMEEHTSPDQDAMASHMVDHMGDAAPNAGAEADAGQGAMPSQAGAGAPMAGM